MNHNVRHREEALQSFTHSRRISQHNLSMERQRMQTIRYEKREKQGSEGMRGREIPETRCGI